MLVPCARRAQVSKLGAAKMDRRLVQAVLSMRSKLVRALQVVAHHEACPPVGQGWITRFKFVTPQRLVK